MDLYMYMHEYEEVGWFLFRVFRVEGGKNRITYRYDASFQSYSSTHRHRRRQLRRRLSSAASF